MHRVWASGDSCGWDWPVAESVKSPPAGKSTLAGLIQRLAKAISKNDLVLFLIPDGARFQKSRCFVGDFKKLSGLGFEALLCGYTPPATWPCRYPLGLFSCQGRAFKVSTLLTLSQPPSACAYPPRLG